MYRKQTLKEIMKKVISFILFLIATSTAFAGDIWAINPGNATIDGVISSGEWNNANWHNLNSTTYGNTSDLSNCQYAAMWNPIKNLLYVAIKVTDTTHYLFNSYAVENRWDGMDCVEIYTDFSNSNDTGLCGDKLDLAQQWVVSKKPADGEWATLWGGQAIPATLQPDFKVVRTGNYFVYELAFTPYSMMDVNTPANSTIMQLAKGITIGFDVVIGSRNNSLTGYGHMSNTSTGGKSTNASLFQDHLLKGVKGTLIIF